MKNKPIAVMSADWHIDDKNTSLMFYLAEQVAAVCKKYKVPHILLGDLFESRQSQKLSVLKCAEDCFEALSNEGVMTYAIAGNHDKVNYESGASYLDAFKHFPDLFVNPKRPMAHENFYFAPFLNEKTLYPSTIPQPEGENSFLFTHVAIEGVKNNDGGEAEGVDKNLFRKFKKVFVGHYHEAQEYDNIHYIGSIKPKNFGESNNKGVTVLFEDGSTEFVKLLFPEYHTTRCKAKDVSKELAKIQFVKGDFYRFVVSGTKAELKGLTKSKFEELGVKLETVEDSVETKHNLTETIKLTDTQVIEEASSFFANKNNPKLSKQLLDEHLTN